MKEMGLPLGFINSSPYEVDLQQDKYLICTYFKYLHYILHNYYKM